MLGGSTHNICIIKSNIGLSEILFQVSTEGYLSFGRAVPCCPSLTSDTADSDYTVSPFEADINIANGRGNVSYEVHDISTSPGLLSHVSSFIRQQELNNFAGTWMLVAEWSDVPLSGQENSIVRMR